MLDGHFDYGNGYHGRVYLNPHRIFRQPSLIWRFAQDLIDILPESIVSATEVVAGPVMGGALLAHTIAGLLDGRRSSASADELRAAVARRLAARSTLRPFYRRSSRASACCSPTTCGTRARRSSAAKALVEEAGGTVIGDGRDLRSAGGDRRSRRAEHRAGGVPRAGELPGLRMSAVPARPARDDSSETGARAAVPRVRRARLRARSDPDRPAVRRLRGSGGGRASSPPALAFGRVASVMASVEAVCRVLGTVAGGVRSAFDPARDGGPLRPLVHRWTRGDDFVALLWMLRRCSRRTARSSARSRSATILRRPTSGPRSKPFAARARAVDCRPAYGRRPRSSRASSTSSRVRRPGRPASG